MSTSFDPLKVDVYAQHLSEVNNTNEVVAHEDIYNEQGAVLIKKGQAVDQKIVDRIVQFKLLKPLDQSVKIDNCLDAKRLYDGIISFIAQVPECVSIHQILSLEKPFRQFCADFVKHPLLVQKLTVMSIQLPREFSKSIFVAWYALALATKMKLSESDKKTCFFAGLCQDIGMLHIARDFDERDKKLGAEQWRMLQGHVVIGQRILQQVPNVPEVVATAVLEHHECDDGTGYPSAKTAKSLSVHGQIVAMADMVMAIFINRIRPEKRSSRDLLPILQMNSHLHNYDVSSAAILLLKELELSAPCIVENSELPSFVNRQLAELADVNCWLQGLREAQLLLQQEVKSKKLRAIRALLLHLMVSVRGSGLFSEGYRRWLQQVYEAAPVDMEEAIQREIEDSALMVKEIRWHLRKLHRMMELVAKDANLVQEGQQEELMVCLQACRQYDQS